MSKNVAYTADFDIRADFTVPLFMSSGPDIKFGDTATMSLANMMGECLKNMYESVTVEAGSASIYLHRMYGCSPIQKLRRKKIDLDYLYSVTFSVMLPVSGAEISVFDRIDTNDKVREEIENDLAVEVVAKNFQPTYSMSMRLHIVHIAVVALGTRDKINEHLPPKPTWIIHKGCDGFFVR